MCCCSYIYFIFSFLGGSRDVALLSLGSAECVPVKHACAQPIFRALPFLVGSRVFALGEESKGANLMQTATTAAVGVVVAYQVYKL